MINLPFVRLLMTVIFKSKWIKYALYIGTSALLILALFCSSVYMGCWGLLPSKDDLKEIKQAEASVLLDANNILLGKYFILDRQIVDFKALPEHLVHACIATEDARFY